MKTTKALLLTALCCASAQGALVVVDNYIGEQNGDTGGAVGNFQVQSFTPTVAGPGATDTVVDNAPIPTSVFLQDVTFLRAVDGTVTAAENVFINVYTDGGTNGTFLGSSTNSFNVDDAVGLTSLTWVFDNLELPDSSAEYGFVFSTTAEAGDAVLARFQVARDSGGGFGDSYTAGTADDGSANTSPTNFDARFAVTYDTIPEPSVAILGSLGLAGLMLRRRR